MVRGLLRTSFLIILVVALMIGVSGVVSADNMGIECLETPGVFYYPNYDGIIDTCTVAAMVPGLQRVDVADSLNADDTIPLSVWIFNNLTIPDGFTFTIGNSIGAPGAETIQSYGECGGDSGDYYHESLWCSGCGGDCGVGGAGGEPGVDSPDTFRDGGAGGNGGDNGKTEGGGGGAGGVGGIQFYLGGLGGDGGRGGNGDSAGGAYTDRSYAAGANVRIIVRDTLTFGENSKLSVAGDNGQQECESWNNGGESDYSEGGGAGGGGGGAGGGSLVLFVNNIDNGNDPALTYGTITANGGRGGIGCRGGNDKQSAGGGVKEGGGGGGAGGGGDGGSVTIYYLESLQGFPLTSINVSPGKSGVFGDGYDEGMPGELGQIGKGGSAPAPSIANEFEIGSCTDKIDNDFDNLIDFQDSDCFNLSQPTVEWDNNGPIPGAINLPGAIEYSAYDVWDPIWSYNGSDGICGDDTGCIDPCIGLNHSQCDVLRPLYGCDWDNNVNGMGWGCFGSPKDCFSLEKEECNLDTVCLWLDKLGSTDQSYVAKVESINEYIGRYYCGQDKKTTSGGIDISSELSSIWKWWDAYEQGTSFLIHSYDGIDYIANGQEWFYCNANESNIHESGSNAKPVAGGENFSSSVDNGGFTCIAAVNVAAKYFDDNYGPSDGWTGLFDLCENDSDTWCCNETNADGQVPGYTFDNNGGFLNSLDDGDCGKFCYFRESDINPRRPLFELKPTPLANLVTNYYCTTYYFDPFCSDEEIPLFDFESADLREKRSCGFGMAGCLIESIALDQSCGEIQQYRFDGVDTEILFTGELCSNVTYCGGTQEYLLSEDVFPESENYDPEYPICCLKEDDVGTNICIPYESPFDDENCIAAGGDWLFFTDLGDYVCEGGAIYDTNCCLGGTWVPRFNKFMWENLAQPDSFICYNQQNKNRFAECCTDYTKCFNNEEQSFFYSDNKYNYGYFGKGGVLHTLQNYDSYDEVEDEDGVVSKLLVDFVKIVNLEKSQPTPFEIKLSDSSSYYAFTNWEDFDYLEFDIAYNIDKVARIKIENSINQITYFHNLTKYLTNGKKEMRWHHVVIPLNKSNNTVFNFSKMQSIFIETDYEYDNLYVAVDAFFLSEDPDKVDGLIFTDNYYCTGNFGNWISNLDGETDKGFLDYGSTDYNLEDYGKYWYACEAQASFDWTGHACCGDDTRVSHYSETNEGEYYEDSAAGCFHGNTVPSNTLVGYILNDKSYNNLMFYNESFFVCAQPVYPDANKTISYNGSGELTGDGNLVKDENILPPYSVKGDYICDAVTYDWIPISSISRARIIASKMYNLTFVNATHKLSNYDIYCDDVTSVSPELNDFSSELQNQIVDFCTLSYLDSGTSDYPERVMIGLSLDYDNAVTVETFFESLYEHLELRGLVGSGEEPDRDDLVDSCDGIDAGSNNYTHFFQYCDPYNGAVHLRYNPDFKILFMSLNVDTMNDFNGFYKDDASIMDYIRSYWRNFIGLFDGWFGGGNQAGQNVTWTNQTTLPIFASDGNIYSKNVVELNQVYISSKGTKEIRGFTEQRYVQDKTLGSPDIYVAIEYVGFNNSVKFIANRYYGTPDYYQNLYELNYFVGNNSQFIVIVNATQAADVSFEQDFDWRRLGPMLRINSSPGTYEFQASPNNGVVDYGEWCDTDENGENPVFKFGRSDCGFWNETHEVGTMICDSDDQTLNHINCVVTVPTVCEDFELGYFCETPTFTHPTNIDVDGCKAVCQSEGLSCCMYNSSGDFCYASNAQRVVSTNPNFKAANCS